MTDKYFLFIISEKLITNSFFIKYSEKIYNDFKKISEIKSTKFITTLNNVDLSLDKIELLLSMPNSKTNFILLDGEIDVEIDDDFLDNYYVNNNFISYCGLFSIKKSNK
jgi:hypothetical protein